MSTNLLQEYKMNLWAIPSRIESYANSILLAPLICFYFS